MKRHIVTTRRPVPGARIGAGLLVILISLSSAGCYYLQAASGHASIMMQREEIAELLEDGELPPDIRDQLALVDEARRFAVRELRLPDNGSYTTYVDLQRDYVVWNVFAAPEFAVEPHQWCFPIVGCVNYRGHFRKQRAESEARRLGRRGFDTAVAGVPAYSTLGRFRDPVLNTMLAVGPENLVATIFHELAHQKLYLAGDTLFNESFATAVADVGLERWLGSRSESDNLAAFLRRRVEHGEFLERAAGAREALRALYAERMDAAEMRARKQLIFDRLADSYAELARAYGLTSYPRPPANNAELVPLTSYNRLVPGFKALIDRCAGELECFYRAVEELASLASNQERENALTAAGGQGLRPASRLNAE